MARSRMALILGWTCPSSLFLTISSALATVSWSGVVPAIVDDEGTVLLRDANGMGDSIWKGVSRMMRLNSQKGRGKRRNLGTSYSNNNDNTGQQFYRGARSQCAYHTGERISLSCAEGLFLGR